MSINRVVDEWKRCGSYVVCAGKIENLKIELDRMMDEDGEWYEINRRCLVWADYLFTDSLY